MLVNKTQRFRNSEVDYGITTHEQKDTGRLAVITTDLLENTGTSVTDMFEQLATRIYNEHLKNTPKITG